MTIGFLDEAVERWLAANPAATKLVDQPGLMVAAIKGALDPGRCPGAS